MSIGGALNAAISALQAQGQVLSTVSTNLANADTSGYKAVSSGFSTLVTQQATANFYPAGGVSVNPIQNVTAQGEVTDTGVTTNAALVGNGMFVVAPNLTNTTDVGYTRQGSFVTDSSGYLVNNGQYLLGWPTNAGGTITTADTSSSSGLQPINVYAAASTASPTTSVSLQYNMPADASVGFSQNTTIQVYDSLGDAQDLPVTWTKGSDNTWSMQMGNPVSPTTSSQTGTISGTTNYAVVFNSNGTLKGVYTNSGTATSVSPGASNLGAATITVGSNGWNDGASASSVSLSLGTANLTNGLTQYASGSSSPSIDIISESKDGVAFGSLQSTSIGSDGTVSATYTNGQTIDIYKIAVATFNNYDGLALGAHNVYGETQASGDYTLHTAGQGGSATMTGGATEGSTVDTTGEFSTMILAQQAYSAASQVVTTSNTFYTTLEQAVRG